MLLGADLVGKFGKSFNYNNRTKIASIGEDEGMLAVKVRGVADDGRTIVREGSSDNFWHTEGL